MVFLGGRGVCFVFLFDNELLSGAKLQSRQGNADDKSVNSPPPPKKGGKEKKGKIPITAHLPRGPCHNQETENHEDEVCNSQSTQVFSFH